jgi:hypothetical protein
MRVVSRGIDDDDAAALVHDSVDGAPILRLERVGHVGTLDVADKGDRSYEGEGLSVGLHPDEWVVLARLGGRPIWELTRRGGKFLDFHAFRASGALERVVLPWGLERGYVRMEPRWRVDYYDAEREEERFPLFDRREEADAEALACGEDGAADGVRVCAIMAPVATDAFPDRTVRAGEDMLVEDLLVVAWTRAAHPPLDGVWWDDQYAPELLSLPRGVIHVDRVAAWTAKQVDTP